MPEETTNKWEVLKPEVEKAIMKLRNLDGIEAGQIAEWVTELSAWYASVNSEVVEREYAYNLSHRNYLISTPVAAKAKVFSSATKEWKDWQEALSYSKSILEILRGGRRQTKLAESEKNESMY